MLKSISRGKSKRRRVDILYGEFDRAEEEKKNVKKIRRIDEDESLEKLLPCKPWPAFCRWVVPNDGSMIDPGLNTRADYKFIRF